MALEDRSEGYLDLEHQDKYQKRIFNPENDHKNNLSLCVRQGGDSLLGQEHGGRGPGDGTDSGNSSSSSSLRLWWWSSSFQFDCSVEESHCVL